MKKLAKQPCFGKRSRCRKAILKKCNRQVFSIVASLGIMVGNYVFVPIQALAIETPTVVEDSPSQEPLSTLATEAPEVSMSTSPTTSNEESQEPVVETEASQMENTQSGEQETSSTIKNHASPALQKKEQEQAATQSILDWEYELKNGRMVISSYLGDPTNITVPAELEGYPVQIDLNTVLGANLKNATENFAIESSQEPVKAVKLTGTFYQLFYSSNGAPIRTISFGNADISAVTYIRSTFENCKNLEKLDVTKWDTSTFQDFSRMFLGCSKLAAIDLTNWRTDSLTFLPYMFGGCSSLTEIDLNSFDTSKVTSALGLFNGCAELKDVDLSGWDTSSLEDMNNMFSDCTSLTSLDLSGFDTSQVNTMVQIFSNCSSLTSLNLASWSTQNNSNMYEAFIGCEKLETIQLSRSFQFISDHALRNLPAPSSGTSSHWVRDHYQAIYDSTANFLSAHKNLQDDDVHTYTIKETHEISFDTNGGDNVPATQAIFTGELATNPQYNGKKVGYQFAGWLLNDHPFVFDTHAIDQPLTLKANWESNRYSVKYDSNGGSGSMNDQLFAFDEEKNLSANAFTKNGYRFVGWNTEPDGRGEAVADQKLVKNLSANDGEIIPLYAQWEMETYQVSFESNGGSVVAPKTYTIEKGIASFETPTRKGYDFAGWYEGNQKIVNIPVGQIGNRTLTARWLPKLYKIIFEDEALPPKTYTIESKLALPISLKKRTGYHFIGWEIKDVLSQALNPTVITEIQPGRTGDLLLKASWRANSYAIHYDANGGTGTMNQQVLAYDQTVKLAKNGFTKEREQFVGWNTKKDGSGTAFSNEQEVQNLTAEKDGTVTLFAQWKSTTSTLQDLVNQEKTKNRDKNRYTAESWSNYEKAMKEAEEVLAVTNDPAKHQTALENLQTAIAKLVLTTPQIANYTRLQPLSIKQYPTAKHYPLTGFVNDPSFIVVGIATVGIAFAGWTSRNARNKKR